MKPETARKIKQIADRFNNMTFEEILNLPDVPGYEFIDDFVDGFYGNNVYGSKVQDKNPKKSDEE